MYYFKKRKKWTRLEYLVTYEYLYFLERESEFFLDINHLDYANKEEFQINFWRACFLVWPNKKEYLKIYSYVQSQLLLFNIVFPQSRKDFLAYGDKPTIANWKRENHLTKINILNEIINFQNCMRFFFMIPFSSFEHNFRSIFLEFLEANIDDIYLNKEKTTYYCEKNYLNINPLQMKTTLKNLYFRDVIILFDCIQLKNVLDQNKRKLIYFYSPQKIMENEAIKNKNLWDGMVSLLLSTNILRNKLVHKYYTLTEKNIKNLLIFLSFISELTFFDIDNLHASYDEFTRLIIDEIKSEYTKKYLKSFFVSFDKLSWKISNVSKKNFMLKHNVNSLEDTIVSILREWASHKLPNEYLVRVNNIIKNFSIWEVEDIFKKIEDGFIGNKTKSDFDFNDTWKKFEHFLDDNKEPQVTFILKKVFDYSKSNTWIEKNKENILRHLESINKMRKGITHLGEFKIEEYFCFLEALTFFNGEKNHKLSQYDGDQFNDQIITILKSQAQQNISEEWNNFLKEFIDKISIQNPKKNNHMCIRNVILNQGK